MYELEEHKNYFVICNETRKLRVLEFEEPNQIKIIDITYGNRTNGGYWTSINNYFDDFKSTVISAKFRKESWSGQG